MQAPRRIAFPDPSIAQLGRHRPGSPLSACSGALSALLFSALLCTPPSPARAQTDDQGPAPALTAPAALKLAAAPGEKAARRPRAQGPRIDYSLRAEVQAFIADLAARHQFGEDELKALFAQVRFDESIVRLMTPAAPSFKRSWEVYRSRFLDATRINAGLAFWRTHAEAISRAARTYGVPEEIIVSIIGVETVYGRITGEYRVIDALTVLSFDYTRRADFFRAELEQFLLHAREMKLSPLSFKGSFAGAIGYPQFMPSSIRRWATDFDGDGLIDLRASPVDAIGSVARFLAEHGWRSGEPIVFEVRMQRDARLQELLAAGIEPKFTTAELADRGIEVQGSVPEAMPLALIDLPNGDNPTTYLAGPRNFYVITRYNRSSFYAMAVRDLALTLANARQRE